MQFLHSHVVMWEQLSIAGINFQVNIFKIQFMNWEPFKSNFLALRIKFEGMNSCLIMIFTL